MSAYRCPDPSHADEVVLLKANNERVFECPSMHRFWRREEGGSPRLVNLVSQEAFAAVEMPAGEQAARPALNFMVDVPRLTGGLDFNALSLTPAQWKIIARVDGKSNLEEVRLLSGLTPPEAERLVNELVDAGLLEIRRKGGR